MVQDKNIHEIVIEETILSSKQPTVNGTVTVREADYVDDDHERSHSTRFNTTRKGIFDKKTSVPNDEIMYGTQSFNHRSKFKIQETMTT